MTGDASKPVEVVEVAAAIVEAGGRYLLTKRPRGSHLEGLWEFPGGKREPGETMEACLHRELWEELAVRVGDVVPFASVRHEYTERTVELHFYRCRIVAGEARASVGSELRWVAPAELDQYELPAADRGIIDTLRESERRAR